MAWHVLLLVTSERRKRTLGGWKGREEVDEIITPSQVAALLKIHVRTVYRLAEAGVIPGNRIGRNWRFSKNNVLELVSRTPNQRAEGESPAGHKHRNGQSAKGDFG